MARERKVFLYEPDTTAKRIILHVLAKLNSRTTTFSSFTELYSTTPEHINLLIISYSEDISVSKINTLVSKYRKINPKLRACIIADEKLAGFPCTLLRPLKSTFLEKKLEIEFYITESQSSKPKFDFIGVGIASSTGGPITLQHFFSNLPFTKQAAFFLVLHAPEWMLKTYSERLDQITKYNVRLATDNMNILPGNIYVAPGDFHMLIDGYAKKIKLNKDEPVNFLRPAADPTFFSIAENFAKKSLGIIFTGMGYDGTLGAGKIHAEGGKIIVQAPDTAVIHSMPESVIETGIADKIVPLEKMPEETIKFIKRLKVK